MLRPTLEVADIFRDHGAAWRDANRGHVSLGQLKVMTAIERCRTAALGGHVTRCENGACGHTVISFNSCRNRHCPKCQGTAAAKWLATLPAGTASEEMVNAFLEGAVGKYPEFAAQWTKSTTDETKRQKYQIEVARQWLKTDPSAALKWIDSLGLPEEIKQSLKTPLP